MLLLLLLISSGCDVNIPGCGKRSLPFFKKIVPPTPVPPAPAPPVNTSPTPMPTVANQTTQPKAAPTTKAPSAATTVPTKEPAVNNAVEMSISKPKVVVPTSTPTATATPLEAEKIAYTTLEKGKPTLWLMDPDGTNRTRLTAVGTSSWYPLWSPNGKTLAFLSDMTGGKINLFTVKKGTMDFEQVTDFSDMSINNPDALKPPFSWSPRSDEIAYNYHNQVWKVELGPSHQSSTLATFDSAYTISGIEWAPHRDNKYIAFLVKKGDSFFALMLVNPRLKDQLTLVNSDKPLADLDWTADAGKIAYLSNLDSVYTAAAERSLHTAILLKMNPKLGPLALFNPADESPNPTLMVLAKMQETDEDYRVAIVDKTAKDTDPKAIDPGSVKFLTEPGVVDAIWSPDGKKIAYGLSNGEFWEMDSMTGANKVRVAATGIQFPNWSKK